MPGGLSVQDNPSGETVEVKATEPAKPFIEAIVIVELALPLARPVMLVGLAATVKSITVTETVAE